MPTGGGKPPPNRLATGAAIGAPVPRPGTRSGVGALGAQIKVADRPVTQQGLGGARIGTAMARGPMRQVQDKTYYLGVLRSKIQELTSENQKLSKEIELYNQENSTYLTYEKRAETLAAEIKELQKEMADYNTLMDKLNTDTDVAAIMADFTALQMQNNLEAKNIDVLFAERHDKEAQAQTLQAEIEKQKQAAENTISSMSPAALERYQELKAENVKIKKELEEQQAALNSVNAKVDSLQEEMSSSEMKQTAYRLHQQLAEVLEKRDEWREKDKETPQEERERLLRQVKADNQEIANLQKKTAELQDQLSAVGERIRQADADLEESKGEKTQKYKDLRKRESDINEFLGTFEESKKLEQERALNLESNIVAILAHISQSMKQSQHLPSVDQFETMQADLDFKKKEMEKSEATTQALETENIKLQMEVVKVQELDGKITKELSSLKESIATMTHEIEVFSDLAHLQEVEENKRKELAVESEKLSLQREASKQRTEALAQEYESAKVQLEENDTFSQLRNLEKKCEHHELNNFAMKDFIAARQSEGNYKLIAQDVLSMMAEYNTVLCQQSVARSA
ncbi:hypothetical protein EMCRGX_G017003 [Ephydatia muelleri]